MRGSRQDREHRVRLASALYSRFSTHTPTRVNACFAKGTYPVWHCNKTATRPERRALTGTMYELSPILTTLSRSGAYSPVPMEQHAYVIGKGEWREA